MPETAPLPARAFGAFLAGRMIVGQNACYHVGNGPRSFAGLIRGAGVTAGAFPRGLAVTVLSYPPENGG